MRAAYVFASGGKEGRVTASCERQLDKVNVMSRVGDALRALLRNDGFLLENDANERSITHMFAVHLGIRFRGWHVDCEYNRDRHELKTLRLPAADGVPEDEGHARTVFPDIIVHRRGTRKNLLVIEAKKSTSRDSDDWDRVKLSAFVQQLHNRFAVFVVFSTGAGRPGAHIYWVHRHSAALTVVSASRS